jgi:hypothetical protein
MEDTIQCFMDNLTSTFHIFICKIIPGRPFNGFRLYKALAQALMSMNTQRSKWKSSLLKAIQFVYGELH